MKDRETSMLYHQTFKRNKTALALAVQLACPGLMVLPVIYAAAVSAQSTQADFNITAGTLTEVLNQFAEHSGVYLSGNGSLTEGKNSTGLSGQYSVDQALQILLAGSDIAFSRSGKTVTLVKGGSGVMMFNPVMVDGVIGIGDDLQAVNTSVAVSYETLQRTHPSDLKDIFAAESSVAVGGSIPINQKLYLRGIEETALSVTIDGARQNNRVFHHNATTLIDPALLKSVRASAGVAAADDGPGAIGGSIVFETVDVADVLVKDDHFGGFADVGYDANSSAFTTGIGIYGQQQGFSALAFINKVSGDDYTDGNGDTVEFTAPDLLSSLTKVAYEAESGDRFELSYETVNDDAARPFRANLGEVIGGRPTPESRNYDLTRTNAVFNYSNQTDSGLWNPKVVVASSETELITTEAPLADPSSKIVYNGITESESLVAENLFVTDLANITVGVDYYEDSATFLFEGAPDLKESAENTGVFVQFRQTSDQLQLSYGLRYDKQSFTGTDKSEQNDSGASANIFAQYAVREYLTLNVGYANVWGGIALSENFILNSEWDYSQGVKSVESENFVVGFESNVGKFNFGANVYETDISNGRTPSYRAGPGIVADFDISGHDIFVSYETVYSALRLKYSNVKADKDGETANSYDGSYFTAPLGGLIAISGATSLETLPLTLGFNAEISLENDFVAGGVDSTQDGYTVINVFADYLALENLNLRLSVNNISDTDYVDRATYGQEFASIRPLFEPGRSVAVSARYNF